MRRAKDAGGYGEYEADAACDGGCGIFCAYQQEGKVTIKKKQKKAKMRPLDLNHNRKKQYILQEGVPVPFLQDLGVMTEEGKIVHARFDKFRQINRFLEFIEDILPQLDSGRELTILDFGCGKSYLTLLCIIIFMS